ncbi:MAG: GTPase Era [Alphaproteobacteria bacterium]|nr:GTPase Era [Alphaproteobacteria bacterium]
MMRSVNKDTRAGFATLIGAPNAGKSTLMNAMVGQKVSIVTPKVQTTRSRIRGITMQDEAQIIFVDTPGIFSPKRRLDRAMVNAAWQGAADNDVLLLLNDCARVSLDDETKMIIAKLVQQEQAAALILNKIDLATPEQVLVRTAELSTLFSFEKVFMISAHTGNGLSDLKSWLSQKMPLGPYLYDPNDLSDLPVRLLAAEILREKLFLNLHQELPYQMTVESESWVEREDGSAEVRLSVFVAREGHRGIVLGKRGQTIKRISQAARKELERVLERRIHLMCHVKYRKDWMDDKERYTAWNLDFNA